MGNNKKLCILCCYSFVTIKEEVVDQTSLSPEEEDDFDHDEVTTWQEENYTRKYGVLTQFCNQLVSQASTSDGKNFTAGNFFQSLKSFQDILWVCPDCTSSISATIETKLQLDEIESRVSQLQLKILTELKELRHHVEKFYVQMDKLNGIVGMSDVSCLKSCIEAEESDLHGKSNSSNQIYIFRNRISDLVSELKFYHDGLTKRICHPGSPHPDTKGSARKRFLKGKLSKPSPPGHVRLKKQSECKIRLRNSNVERQVPAVKLPEMGLRRSYRRKANLTAKSSDNQKKKSRIKESEPDDVSPAESPFDESGSTQSGDEVEEVGEFPENETNITNISSTVSKHTRSLQDNIVSETGHLTRNTGNSEPSTFKDRIVSRARKRRKATASLQSNAQDPNQADPTYRHHIQYNDEEDTFTVAGIEIIVDNSGMECSLCGYRPKMTTKKKTQTLLAKYLERYMHSHILGHHFTGGFKCQVCSASFRCEKNFRKHLVGHGTAKVLSNFKKKDVGTLKAIEKPGKLKKQASFRERFLHRAQRKIATNLKLRDQAPDYLKDDPIYSYHIEFNKEESSFSLGGIQISVNDEEGTLQCICGFSPIPKTIANRTQAELDRYMDRNIYGHIMSHHLNLFRCKLCMREMKSHWRYREHLKMHETDLFTCDICGKPLKTKGMFECHRWLHLNEEEKAEAIRNGQKNPLEWQEKVKSVTEKLFQCVKCGKNFRRRLHLNKHEATHETFENRSVVCPQCGKVMLRSVYDTYHKKYGCPGNPQKKLECSHCKLKLKNEPSLKRHIQRLHSASPTARPFLCNICGKDYKTQSDLRNHQKIHVEETLWRCGNGCGREFNVKRNCRRHEKACSRKHKGQEPKREEDEEPDEMTNL